MEDKKFVIAGLVFVFVIVSVGVMYWAALQENDNQAQPIGNPVVTNFEECVVAGYPVMESYPQQCSDGTNTFVEDVVVPESYPLETKSEPAPSNNAREQDGCVITGCNGEVCVDEETSQLMGVTPCMYKPEFACYKETICSHNDSGECTWQETPAFSACIEVVRTGGEPESREVPVELGGACTDSVQCIGGVCVLDGDEGGAGHCISSENISGCVMVLSEGEAMQECPDENRGDVEDVLDPPIR